MNANTLPPMNGAESLVRTLVANGVEVCFTNPGTSEMHFVAALDRVDGMRCVLGLFEGVVTGAADGYYRMADKPASTLLHLGPGLGNGLANLHNAKKARLGRSSTSSASTRRYHLALRRAADVRHRRRRAADVALGAHLRELARRRARRRGGDRRRARSRAGPASRR